MITINELSKSLGPLIIRIPLGIIMMAHGSQKLFGIWGGAGLAGTFKIFEEKFGIPPIFTLLAILAEFVGGLGILIGFLTRISAASIMGVMFVAISKVLIGNGFFLRGPSGDGIEFAFALFSMAFYLLVVGGGTWCIDRMIFKDF